MSKKEILTSIIEIHDKALNDLTELEKDYPDSSYLDMAILGIKAMTMFYQDKYNVAAKKVK